MRYSFFIKTGPYINIWLHMYLTSTVLNLYMDCIIHLRNLKWILILSAVRCQSTTTRSFNNMKLIVWSRLVIRCKSTITRSFNNMKLIVWSKLSDLKSTMKINYYMKFRKHAVVGKLFSYILTETFEIIINYLFFSEIWRMCLSLNNKSCLNQYFGLPNRNSWTV